LNNRSILVLYLNLPSQLIIPYQITSIMKNTYILSIFIILNLCLTPFQTTQAALVPVEVTNQKASKKNLKKRQGFHKKQYKKQLKNKFKRTWKKRSPKPEQQNEYGAFWAIIITVISAYAITAILFIIFGFLFGLIPLWITGICMVVTPFLILLIRDLAGTIEQRKFKKKKELEEKKNLE
jgi:Flp pilus assembly protein TadB